MLTGIRGAVDSREKKHLQVIISSVPTQTGNILFLQEWNLKLRAKVLPKISFLKIDTCKICINCQNIKPYSNAKDYHYLNFQNDPQKSPVKHSLLIESINNKII